MNYQKHYLALITRAQNRKRPPGYVEKHHVLPKCLGGADNVENLIYLTAREHYVAHQLLVKMHPEHHGIAYAAKLMTLVGRSQGRVTNRYYEWLKKRHSALQSKIMKEWVKDNNPSARADVKEKRRLAWSGKNNPSYRNPNWQSIEAAAKAVRGKPQTAEHRYKIAQAIKSWHKNNPDKHPMKNPETLAKAIISRRRARLDKKTKS